MRSNTALIRSIQWQSRGAAGADASDPAVAKVPLKEPAASAAAAAVLQPLVQNTPVNAAAAAANREANMEGMCVAEQARRDERPLQPVLEPCTLDHSEAGAPAAAAMAAEAAEERAALARAAASPDACAAALGQPKVALMFLTPGPMPHADVRARAYMAKHALP